VSDTASNNRVLSKSDSGSGREMTVNVGWQGTVISDGIRHHLLHVSWSFFWQAKGI